ncbi:MAG TPA: hypothetical protein P5246_07780, partial [Candidatus Omnitrophota bacterium]|nr:hypothetical protein [Candidatus Omnitrophota bacterium]
KYVSAVIFSKAMKFSMDEANLIFGLSINQAAATLAAVIVGYRLGIFDVTVLNGTIIMIFVTCIIGPFFTEKYGRRIALASEESLERPLNDSARVMVA